METSTVDPVTFETHPSQYRHWKLAFDGPVATLSMDVREDAGLRPRLPPQAQLLRPRRRHRARRRAAAYPLRAPRGPRRRHHQPEGARVLRRRQHLHAGRLEPRLQGELLQVHQRDAAGHRGRQPALGHQVPRRRQRHLRRRRLRAGARVRRDHPGRRREQRGEPAGDAAARRAARHRRADARRGQAQGAARPRRRVQHRGRRREGEAGGRVAPRRRGVSDEPLQGGGRSARARAGGAVRSPRVGPRRRRSARSIRASAGDSADATAPSRSRSTGIGARRSSRSQAPRRHAGRLARGDPRRGRPLLAAARVPRARRRDSAAAAQRAGDRHDRRARGRRSGGGARRRSDARRASATTGWCARSCSSSSGR